MPIFSKAVNSLEGEATFISALYLTQHISLFISQIAEPWMFGKCNTETLWAIKYLGLLRVKIAL